MKHLLSLIILFVSLTASGQTSYSDIISDCSLSPVKGFYDIWKDETLNRFKTLCKEGTDKTSKYAVLVEWQSMPISGDLIKYENAFHQSYVHSSVMKNYIHIKDILFPVKAGCTVKEDYGTMEYFRCNDTNVLQDIKDNRKYIRLLAVFTPGFYISDGEDGSMDHYCANPVGLYLINTQTGTVVLNLNSYIRKLNAQTEKQKLVAANRSRLAEKSGGSKKPRNNQTTKKVRCNTCNGTGKQKWEYPSKVVYETCQTCGGTGYVNSLW